MRVSKRGQVTIPKSLRDRFGLNPHDEVEFVPTKKGLLLRKNFVGSHPVDSLVGILTDFEFDRTDDFIEEIRGR
ncbi:MAG: AbrB/MazE/SpoVT family DNA-binding domain-containing protein [Gammaproteobacteria bacterium]|nr:AbrB/MazE/SpoVT family DNA-binding domain-containing protein [Gammaproteobacteria bacterium]